MRLRIARTLMIGLIKAYKYAISPFLGQNCRFYPGCANYAMEAVELHGVFRGGYLACKRIAKCHPLNPGGYDPVPGSERCEHDCTLSPDT